MVKSIRLLRHAEALKNVENRHGGAGSQLTEYGLSQVKSYIKSNSDPAFGPSHHSLLFVDRPQCEQTALLLASSYGLTASPLTEIAPFHLGVLEGLSEQEAMTRFPEEAIRIANWRKGLIDISELKLPGSTDEKEFFHTGLRVLKKTVPSDGALVIVGTRSVLVLFWNILSGHTPNFGGGYVEKPWGNMEFVDFHIKEDVAEQLFGDA